MPIIAFIGGLGAPELAIILVIILILFGAGRLPTVFSQFGKAVKNFRDAQKEPPLDADQRARELADHGNEAEEVLAEKERERVV
jgi:sec-independent protein translocase protein TatA